MDLGVTFYHKEKDEIREQNIQETIVQLIQ